MREIILCPVCLISRLSLTFAAVVRIRPAHKPSPVSDRSQSRLKPSNLLRGCSCRAVERLIHLGRSDPRLRAALDVLE